MTACGTIQTNYNSPNSKTSKCDTEHLNGAKIIRRRKQIIIKPYHCMICSQLNSNQLNRELPTQVSDTSKSAS